MTPAQEQEHSINVIVAEATVMACELLANALSRTPEMRVVGWELDSESALARTARVKPHVALISSDLQDGAARGLSLASALRARHPEIRSVILLDRPDRQSTIDAFRAGARGVLSRGDGLALVPKCVRRVSEGQVWANSTELLYLLDTMVQTKSAHTLSDNCRTLLTPREQDVVQLLADGLGNREIAARLKLSEHTIKNYLFQVFDKIGVSSRVELVLCALSSSVVKPTGKPNDDRVQGVAAGLRRRPDTMTNA
jgi:two-component system, NarL family, response regulator DegU